MPAPQTSSPWQRLQAMPLWQRVLVALVLGAAAGWLIGPPVSAIGWVAELFVRLIRMLIVPLVFSTLAAGIVGMQQPGRMVALGGKAAALYLLTTVAAVGIGLGLAVLLQPGRGIGLGGGTAVAVAPGPSPMEQLLGIVPDNIVAAFADGNVLAVILVAALVGAGVVTAGPVARPLADLLTALAAVMLKITGMVMQLAPIGVFALVAVTMAEQGPQAFVNVGMLVLVVYLGGLLHMGVTHLGLVRLAGGMTAGQFLRGVRAPQLMAFSTSSSAATLPLSITAAETELGVSRPVAAALLPLGATVNMDGTALYVAAVAVFATQVFGVPLAAPDYLLIALTTVLVSVGTASVPSASLFLMAAVLEVTGITPAQTALVIGFVLPFDRLLDMWRTLVNVTGDLAVVRAVSRWEPDTEG